MAITITEPHPTVAVNTYVHAGRGGLGNTFRAPVTTPATGVPTAADHSLKQVRSSSSAASPSTGTVRFYAGRGGAGNAHPVAERRSLSLDEEYNYAAAMAQAATSGHVGRGGAGNVFSGHSLTASFSRSKKSRQDSDASSSSHDSGSSHRSGFWSRFRS